MVPSSASETGRASRAFLWIAVVAMVLAAGLSLAWYVMANRLDAAVKTAIETAGGQGVRLDCRNQAVFGYPFRLGLRCDALQIEASESNFAARGGELRTAAQIYRPTRIVAELDGPFALSAEGTPPFRIDWTLAQASADFWTEGLDRLSVVLDEPGIAAGPVGAIQPLARSERIEFHARRRDQALDIAFLDRAIKAADPALAALPAFDISGDLTIEDAADWLSGERSGETLGQALAGKSGAVRSLRIALSSARDGTGTSLPGSGEISGLFSVAEGGRLSGDFDVAVTDPAALAALVSTVAPDAAGIAATIASGIAFAGRTENGRTTFRVSIQDGEAALGIIPLGRIPPLR